MADKNILHMVTPLKHISPFDVNMAVDAGYDVVFPYTDVKLEEISGLVQDAIFSRRPGSGHPRLRRAQSRRRGQRDRADDRE